MIKGFQKGFTLIELLVAITIIGVLSAVLFANFIGVRERARDTQRKSDLRQIQAALELYKADAGRYPDSSSNRLTAADCLPNPPGPGSFSYLQTRYLEKIPCNPRAIGGGYSMTNGNYFYFSTDGKTYVLRTCLENRNDTGSNTLPTISAVYCTGASSANPMRYYDLRQP